MFSSRLQYQTILLPAPKPKISCSLSQFFYSWLLSLVLEKRVPTTCSQAGPGRKTYFICLISVFKIKGKKKRNFQFLLNTHPIYQYWDPTGTDNNLLELKLPSLDEPGFFRSALSPPMPTVLDQLIWLLIHLPAPSFWFINLHYKFLWSRQFPGPIRQIITLSHG